MKNEILENSEDIKNYNFLLSLIYNNIPIENIGTNAEKDLKTLIDNNYINDEFKLKIIYLIPNLGSYNLNIIKNDMNKLEKNHKDEMVKLKNTIENNHKTEIKLLKNTIEKNYQADFCKN